LTYWFFALLKNISVFLVLNIQTVYICTARLKNSWGMVEKKIINTPCVNGIDELFCDSFLILTLNEICQNLSKNMTFLNSKKITDNCNLILLMSCVSQ